MRSFNDLSYVTGMTAAHGLIIGAGFAAVLAALGCPFMIVGKLERRRLARLRERYALPPRRSLPPRTSRNATGDVR